MVSEGRSSSTLAAAATMCYVAAPPASLADVCCPVGRSVLLGTDPIRQSSSGPIRGTSSHGGSCPPRPVSRMRAPSPMHRLRRLITRPWAPFAPCFPTRWFPNFSWVRSGRPPCTRITDLHRLCTRPMVCRPMDSCPCLCRWLSVVCSRVALLHRLALMSSSLPVQFTHLLSVKLSHNNYLF
jgi:hypothetical protein